MEAVVLAGGRGTRLGSMTDQLPKPMLPVLGKPFIEHLLDLWAQQGVRRFIISAGYRHEVIDKHFREASRKFEIVISVEEKPLGTGGGLLYASRLLREEGPFLCLNGDTFFEVDLNELLHFHSSKKALATLSLFEPESEERFEGVEIDRENRISGWSKRGENLKNYANGGVYLLERRMLDRWKSWDSGAAVSLENAMIPALLEAGEAVYGRFSKGAFIDIGTPEDFGRAEQFLGRANA